MVRSLAEGWMSDNGRRSSHVGTSCISAVFVVGWRDNKCVPRAEDQYSHRRRHRTHSATTRPTPASKTSRTERRCEQCLEEMHNKVLLEGNKARANRQHRKVHRRIPQPATCAFSTSDPLESLSGIFGYHPANRITSLCRMRFSNCVNRPPRTTWRKIKTNKTKHRAT